MVLICLSLVFSHLLHTQLNWLPQLILFYVVPLSLVYSQLQCNRMRRLWVSIWAPDLLQWIRVCMFHPRVLLPLGLIFQVIWQSIASILSGDWDSYSVGNNSTIFLYHHQWSYCPYLWDSCAVSLSLNVWLHFPWDSCLSLVVWPSLICGYSLSSDGVWLLLLLRSQPDWSPGKVFLILVGYLCFSCC